MSLCSRGSGLIGYYVIISANKMSKARNYRGVLQGSSSRSRIRTLIESQSKLNRITGAKLEVSRLLEQTRCHTIDAGHDQIRKESLYNKNIAHFRQSFKLNDTHLLPFLASLRTIKQQTAKAKPVQTIVAPFQAERTTLNQKIKKNINDVKANPFRLSKINYRWHNASGAGVRAACEFECGLRLFNDCRNPEFSSFNSTISPIHLKTVQPQRYRLGELICPRQNRLFTIEK